MELEHHDTEPSDMCAWTQRAKTEQTRKNNAFTQRHAEVIRLVSFRRIRLLQSSGQNWQTIPCHPSRTQWPLWQPPVSDINVYLGP